ncbi:MAG TPA: helix-turn-helix domain-containing protein [Candidatus Dormibacteraeota bacterium]|nr:helix-turn-helix domain-containing protein [Candidatus Dormibacteraeota bacterium]
MSVWELVHASPEPSLRGVVIGYEGFRHDVAGALMREHPSALVPVIIDFADGWQVSSPADGYRPQRRRGFVAGVHDGTALVEALGPTRGVQVNLTPLGARRLLGVPMHELVNRTFLLRDVLGREVDLLTERLAEGRGWPERFALVDAAIRRRLERAAPLLPEVEWAWGRLERSGGAVPIGRLGEELDWSRKRMAAAFRDQIGLTPKAAARVLRFGALTARLRTAREQGWADLAAELGYYDQAHLVREVRALAGTTPTALRAQMAIYGRPGTSVLDAERAIA